jgi:Ca-activated chloride channel family protein
MVPAFLRKSRPGAELFAFFSAAGKDTPGDSLGRRFFFADLWFCISLGCLIIALAGPRWGIRIVNEYRRDLDLVFALDLSRSMNVRDLPSSSRLERALYLAGDLVTNRGLGGPGGVRFAAAIGKGRGILALPLTDDTEALTTFLEGLGGFSLTGRGTNLEILMDAAAEAFQDAFPTRRELVLFSDGESLSGSLAAALDRARKRDISVTILGLGTEAGGTIPLEEGREGERILLDDGGVPVISFRRGEFLKNAARRAGGVYLDGNRADAAFLLAEHIRSLSPAPGKSGRRREAGAQWFLFVIAALLSQGVFRLLGTRRRRPGEIRGRRSK